MNCNHNSVLWWTGPRKKSSLQWLVVVRYSDGRFSDARHHHHWTWRVVDINNILQLISTFTSKGNSILICETWDRLTSSRRCFNLSFQEQQTINIPDIPSARLKWHRLHQNGSTSCWHSGWGLCNLRICYVFSLKGNANRVHIVLRVSCWTRMHRSLPRNTDIQLVLVDCMQ